MEELLTPHLWLQAPATVRQRLAKDFGLKRSAGPVCTTQNGKTFIESDGHTIQDLKGINVNTMREYLGEEKVTDLLNLFEMCVDKVQQEMDKKD